ncbi:hypothetical protein ACRPHP_07125 [Pantoea allii]|uniref:hypothetical protein n=1 Tax=Pantoea allii TaxID=574096 RepID=UPI003D7BBC91
MERFAKVFESHGRQILVRKGENSDGDSSLNISTMFSGSEMTISLALGDDTEVLDKALERFEQEQADHFAKQFEGHTSAFAAFKSLAGDACDDDDEENFD